MNNSVVKNVNDSGFRKLIPRFEFERAFSQEFEIHYEAESAFYNTETFFTDIENYIQEFEKKECSVFINKNQDLVTQEVIYIDYKNRILYAIKAFLNDDGYLYSVDKAIAEDENEELDKNFHELSIEVYSVRNKENIEIIKKFFEKFISKNLTPNKKAKELNLIVKNEFGLSLKAFPTIDNEVDIDTHYNDDFKEVSEVIVEKLNKKDSNGIVLLSGIKGSGKTNFLRFLSGKIKSKKIIYISPDMTSVLSEPDFVSFLFNYTNSILILEDAENVLKPRKSGGSQAVSNLLNLSDGLLGDALKIQLLCTFNCDVKDIDEALLRPGRLIAQYEFKKLETVKTQSLLKKLYDSDFDIKTPMTLAEIYNYKEKQFTNSDKSKSIGFSKI